MSDSERLQCRLLALRPPELTDEVHELGSTSSTMMCSELVVIQGALGP